MLYQNTLGRAALAPLDAFEGLLYLVGDALIVVAAVALLVRMRRLRAAERQETKWFAFGGDPRGGGRPRLGGGRTHRRVILPLTAGLASLVTEDSHDAPQD